MITYKAVVTNRRKDGSWPVRIRITFKGRIQRISTTIACTDADLTRGGRIKSGAALSRAEELIARMRATCDNLSPFTLEGWEVEDVVAHIREALRAEEFRLDFFAFADEYLSGKRTQTRKGYDTALNAFARFLGRRRVDVNAVTRKMLLSFVDFVDKSPAMQRTPDGLVPCSREKIPGGSSALYVAKLSHIYDAARFRYNDEDTGRILIPRTPFAGLRKSYPKGRGQRSLGVEVMQRLIDARPDSEAMAVAIDAFVLSFATMGANLADLWEARPFDGDEWVYHRKKTRDRRPDGAEVRVFLFDEIKPLVARMRGQGKDARRWWLGALHRWSDPASVTTLVNRQLARWCDEEGVERFTFYAARHTFATLGRAQGVEKATIDDALAHVGDFPIADIYAERNWSLAWEAARKVIALFRWD